MRSRSLAAAAYRFELAHNRRNRARSAEGWVGSGAGSPAWTSPPQGPQGDRDPLMRPKRRNLARSAKKSAQI